MAHSPYVDTFWTPPRMLILKQVSHHFPFSKPLSAATTFRWTRKLCRGLVGAAALLAACAPGATTFSNLSGQGLLPVSSNNPYMGSNIFLAKEMEESNYLYKFMKEKGAPQAIELTGTSEDSSSLKMYYSAKQEMYTASPQIDPTLRSREWIIRGPYAIDRTEYRQVSQLSGTAGGVFEIFGRTEVLGGPAEPAESRIITPVFIEPQRPAHRKPNRKTVTKKTGTTEPTQTAATPTPNTSPNFDQQALAEARQKHHPHTPTPKATPSKSSPTAAGPAVTVERTPPVVIPGEKSAPPANHK
jgi:hypothetical protein